MVGRQWSEYVNSVCAIIRIKKMKFAFSFATSCHRETLTSVGGCRLAELFTRDGPNEAQKNEEGRYMIPDRKGILLGLLKRSPYFGVEVGPVQDYLGPVPLDAITRRVGDHFMFILNYLRDREIDVPDERPTKEEIEEEAKFYGLEELVSLLQGV